MSYDADWSRFAKGQINTAVLARRGEQVIEHLRYRGVRIPPGNRIQLAIRTVRELNNLTLVPTPDNAHVCELLSDSIRTLWEAFFIVFEATRVDRDPDPFPNDSLRYLLKGAEIARGETNPQARNKQFELYVAAFLSMGGASVIPGEPDLRFLYFGEYLGVAMKRVTSQESDTLLGNLKDAADQLARHGLRGFVALNLDTWLDDLDPADDLQHVGASFNESVHEAHRHLEGFTNRPAVMGAFVLGNRIRWNFTDSKPSFEWSSPTQLINFSDVEPEERSREFFEDHFRPRLSNALESLFAKVTRPDDCD